MSATLALTVVVRTVSGLFSTLPIAVRWRSVSRLPAIAGDRTDTTAAGALADAVAVVVGSVPVSTALALPLIAIDTSGYDAGCRHSLHDFTMPRGTRLRVMVDMGKYDMPVTSGFRAMCASATCLVR
ncbi:hypothetical protein WM40_15615 [Robbsia andropogonis]|uniref:Uncharacterized protein n=1 Tax=Robbsia andropogonis TaxID=28092 RepID=A0A0F5JY10_9BURK|nr:hypothetical protein WM40_15615 [Robbsia andropogonis]